MKEIKHIHSENSAKPRIFNEEKVNIRSFPVMTSGVKRSVVETPSIWRQWTKDFPLVNEKFLSGLQERVSARFWIALLLVGIFTVLLRAVNLGRSFEIFIDEITYLTISQSVATNFQVGLYGQPFYLHPPAYFLLEAAFLKVFQPGGDTIHLIYATRFINVVFSGITGVLLFLIARRAGGWLSGLIAVVLFGLNPFIIKIGSLNMLEASAIGFIIAGYWVLVAAIPNPGKVSWIPIKVPLRFRKILFLNPTKKKRQLLKKQAIRGDAIIVAGPAGLSPVDRLPFWRLALAGLFFGLALLIKESTAFLTIFPLAICFGLNWAIRRKDALVTGLVSGLVYAIYPLIVFLSGDWALYSQQKFRGILRFLGMVRITGFNRANGPSLVDTVASHLGLYGTTYFLIALGVIAAALLLSSRDRIARLIGVLTACAYAMMLYLIFVGTLEEQFFSYLVVPSILASGIAVGLIKRSSFNRQFQQKLAVLFICVACFSTGWDSYQWINTHTQPDNGYEQVLAYMRKNVAGGERVASTSETGQYVLGGYQTGPWGMWHAPDALKKYKPEFLLLTPETVKWNYGANGDVLIAWVKEHGTLDYQVTGREGNPIELYRLDWSIGKN